MTNLVAGLIYAFGFLMGALATAIGFYIKLDRQIKRTDQLLAEMARRLP